MKCCRILAFVAVAAFAFTFVTACDSGSTGAPEPAKVDGSFKSVTWKCEDAKCTGTAKAMFNAKKAPDCPKCGKPLKAPEIDKYKCATKDCKKGELGVVKGDKAPTC